MRKRNENLFRSGPFVYTDARQGTSEVPTAFGHRYEPGDSQPAAKWICKSQSAQSDESVQESMLNKNT